MTHSFLDDSTKSGAWPYLAIFGGALAIRALYLVEWSDTPLASVLIGDGRGYQVWAERIAAGEWIGDQVFYQAPFYPYLMGTLYSLVGPEVGVLRGLQALLGSVSCVLLAAVGARLFSPRTGWLAGGLLALYAPALYYEGLVQKASLASFLLILSLWLLVGVESRRRFVAAGMSLAAYALTRENALLLLPLCTVWVLLLPGERRLRHAGALLLGAALLLGPAAARNFALGGGFQPTTSQFGPNLYIGNHAGATGRYLPFRAGRGSSRYERDDATELAEAATGRSLSPGEVSAYWLRRTVDDVAASPRGWLRLLAVKARLVASSEELMDSEAIGVYADESGLLRTLGSFLHFGTLLPLGVVGLWATRRDARRLWLLWGVLAAMAAGPLLFFVTGRYRYPLVPEVVLFAAAGIVALVHRLRTRDWRALAVPAGLLVVIGAISNWPLGLHPDPRSGARYNLGVALREAGRFDDALRELERARELWPGSPDVHFQMGQARVARGDFGAARADFAEAVRLAPDRADTQVGLGMVYMAQGDASRASDAYRAALALDPSHVEAHNNQGSLLAWQGRFAEALVHFRAAAEASGDHAEVLVNLGTAELQTGEPEAALDAYRRALELEPGLASARYGVGLALEALGRHGAAAGIFAVLVRDAAANESAFQGDAITRFADYRATCREPGIRDPDEALRLAASARRLGPEFESMQALAAARAAAGDFEGALRASDAALRLSERDPVSLELLESARRRRAAYLEGRAVFRDCPL